MKNKYFILLVLIALFAACTDKFEEFNTDVKNPAVVSRRAAVLQCPESYG